LLQAVPLVLDSPHCFGSVNPVFGPRGSLNQFGKFGDKFSFCFWFLEPDKRGNYASALLVRSFLLG
jgi:hypothetical protein